MGDLTLYFFTNSNSSGYQSARTGLTGNDAEKATKAQYLFQGLFKSVFIGNSTTQYNNIRYVLNKLGVPLAGNNAGVLAHHEHHFHIAIGVPELRELPKNLLAQSLPEEQSMIDMTPQEMPDVSQLFAQTNVPGISRPSQDWIGTNEKDRRAIQGWIQQQSQIEEGYQPRYSANGPLEIPTLKFNLSVDYAPRLNAAGKIVPSEQRINFGRQACMLLDAAEGTAGAWGPECKITQFIQRPDGRLVTDNQPGALPGAQMYFPSRAGMHTARFILENGAGRKADVTVKIRALLEMPGGQYDDPNTATQFAELGTDDIGAWHRSADLSALLASAQQTLAGFTDLPGTALGETTGEGASAAITLDQNAAGHGWYIDPTPLDNTDDYLPTSDPTVFKAKAGSAAAGKMDMLSVLLHEYGHALGLEHSGTASDFMAASLQPGVRKLPSADELALMARLVAELKGDQTGSGQQDPANPLAPSPLSVLGLLPMGLMRRSDKATSQTTTHTDYLTAINPTLTNGNFAAGQSGTVERWETTGKVDAIPGTITLGESTTAQAHLAQAFIITPQDRFLTFTVSGLALQTNSIQQNGILAAALQDAFEVALTNANTGSNLLAGLATDHNDALLNIQ